MYLIRRVDSESDHALLCMRPQTIPSLFPLTKDRQTIQNLQKPTEFGDTVAIKTIRGQQTLCAYNKIRSHAKF